MMTEIEKELGYTFKNPALLQMALTHRSASPLHNERLEFLGDSVVNIVIAERLYRSFDELSEGQLSRLRSKLVRQEGLLTVASAIELNKSVVLGEGEFRNNGALRPSILADALEAVVGAIFIDAGYDEARRVVAFLYDRAGIEVSSTLAEKDAKTALQEFVQRSIHEKPEYEIVESKEDGNTSHFLMACKITGLNISTTGVGGTRRAAEQDAARKALEQLESN